VPKTVEIDETEYNQDRQIRQALGKIVANPKAKLLLQQAHKTVDPNAITPELDREVSDNDRVAAVKKELDEFKAATEKATREREDAAKLTLLKERIDTGLSRIQSRERLTEDGIKKVREIMENEGILDAEAAYAVFEKRNPTAMPATPRSLGSGAWGFTDVQDTDQGAAYAKSLLDTKGSNDLVLAREVQAALHDIRGGR
jgi:hypothetical protein